VVYYKFNNVHLQNKLFERLNWLHDGWDDCVGLNSLDGAK